MIFNYKKIYLLLSVFILAGSGSVNAAEYVLNGISAWSAAKTNGFQFYPYEAKVDGARAKLDTWIIGARDGGDVWLRYKPNPVTSVKLGQIVGGNMIANKTAPFLNKSHTVKFKAFYGKRLMPGWKIKKVNLRGSYVWVTKPKYGSNKIRFIIKASVNGDRSKSITIRNIILEGPPGKRAQDAFGN